MSKAVEIGKPVEPTIVKTFTVGAELNPEGPTRVNVSVFNPNLLKL